MRKSLAVLVFILVATVSFFITAFKKTPVYAGNELNADMSSSFRGDPAEGGKDVIKRKSLRKYFYLIFILFVLEFLVFGKSYFSGYEENLFSPRRPVYKEIVPWLDRIIKKDEKVLVNQRLGNPEPFFNFYLKKKKKRNFEFRSFRIQEEENKDKVFVDVLPDNPSPTEPLYQEKGGWPKELKVLAEFYDEGLRQKIVVYRYR
jgi:hypothetical protein